MKMPAHQLDSLIAGFIGDTSSKFTLAQLAAVIAPDAVSDAELQQRIELALEDHPEVLHNHESGEYMARQAFFRGAQFLVTPTEYELQHHILIPGHRFAPFCPENIFPSEVCLDDGHTTPAKTKTITIDLELAATYHTLLGAESMFEHFVADHQDNRELLSPARVRSGEAKIKLSVFDLHEFYRRTRFQVGDAIILTVENWNEGSFAFSALPSGDIDRERHNAWIASLGERVEEVIEDFANYLEIPEQFARAFFLAGHALLSAPQAGIEDFYREYQRIQIAYEGGVSSMIIVDEDDESAPPEIGDYQANGDLCISPNNISSLNDILKDIGSFLTQTEVEAFILDQIYHGELMFEAFFQRCFGSERISFNDDVQEAAFLNYLEDLWETRASAYNRFEDQDKGQVRARLVEIISERLDWMHQISAMEVDITELENHKSFEELARLSTHLSSISQLLVSEEHFVSSSEVESLTESLAQLAETQQELIDQLNAVIAAMR